jgi:hypothetical protein
VDICGADVVGPSSPLLSHMVVEPGANITAMSLSMLGSISLNGNARLVAADHQMIALQSDVELEFISGDLNLPFLELRVVGDYYDVVRSVLKIDVGAFASDDLDGRCPILAARTLSNCGKWINYHDPEFRVSACANQSQLHVLTPSIAVSSSACSIHAMSISSIYCGTPQLQSKLSAPGDLKSANREIGKKCFLEVDTLSYSIVLTGVSSSFSNSIQLGGAIHLPDVIPFRSSRQMDSFP